MKNFLNYPLFSLCMRGVSVEKLDKLKKLIGENIELEETSNVYDLMKSKGQYAKMLIFFYILAQEGRRVLSINDVVNYLKEDYTTVKYWVRKFSKTGLIKYYYKPYNYFTIHIVIEKFEQRYVDAAEEIIKSKRVER